MLSCNYVHFFFSLSGILFMMSPSFGEEAKIILVVTCLENCLIHLPRKMHCERITLENFKLSLSFFFSFPMFGCVLCMGVYA